jgi:murein L,D-transpeptidase YafK
VAFLNFYWITLTLNSLENRFLSSLHALFPNALAC